MEESRSRLQIVVLIALAAMAILFGAALIVSHLAFRGVAFSDSLLRRRPRKRRPYIPVR